jgi:hypothetical protein
MPSYTGKRVTVIKRRRATTGSSPSDSFAGVGSSLEGTVTGSDTIGLEIVRTGSKTTIFIPWTSVDHLVIGDPEPQDA